jgi:NAD(P) transhydrogenase subunit beta
VDLTVEITSIVKLAYLASAALFILGLKRMAHPRTAVRGNLYGILGMTLAVIVTLLGVETFGWVLAGIVVGSVIGGVLAMRVQMTEMPQLVALFNGLGGSASTLVAAAELLQMENTTADVLVATAVSGLIGTVTFWGSLVAFGKLQGIKLADKRLVPVAQQAVNALLAAILLLFCVWLAVRSCIPVNRDCRQCAWSAVG